MSTVSHHIALSASLLLVSCVSMKQHQSLEKRLADYKRKYTACKTAATDDKNRLEGLETTHNMVLRKLEALKQDTTERGNALRMAEVNYRRLLQDKAQLEKRYGQLLSADSSETVVLTQDLESSRLELQRKEDELNQLSRELDERQGALKKKEERIAELEAIINEQEQRAKKLKEKIAQALFGFKDKGIQVEERSGKIYVSMEAQLLFASGQTTVNPEGETVLMDLAYVLASQEEIGIIVEGHTDSDPLRSRNHPTDNWELSVLRATSVVKIMLENSTMDPQRITASGRSEFQPVDTEDKAKNRRIEIIISPDLTALFQLISNE